MSDRILVLKTPGRLAVEIRIDAADRRSETHRTQLRGKIAEALGDGE